MTSAYTDTHVTDVLTLDPNLPNEEKTKIVNNRISEIAREYPNCKITTEYARTEPMEEVPNSDVYHLLWSSDRLEIAREVDSRITKIYADLVSLEKMMHYKRNIIDVLKDVLPGLDTDEGRRPTLVEECHDRWVENARTSRSGKEGGTAMKRTILIAITLLALLPDVAKGQWTFDIVSVEAYINDHKKQRSLLLARSTLEYSNQLLHEYSREETANTRK